MDFLPLIPLTLRICSNLGLCKQYKLGSPHLAVFRTLETPRTGLTSMYHTVAVQKLGTSKLPNGLKFVMLSLLCFSSFQKNTYLFTVASVTFDSSFCFKCAEHDAGGFCGIV